MTGRLFLFRPAAFGVLALFLAACGAVATTSPTFEPTRTALPRGGDIAAQAIEASPDTPTASATTAPPTASATIVPTADSHAHQATPTADSHAHQATPTTDSHAHQATPTADSHAEPHSESEEAHTEVIVVNGIEGDPISGEFWFHEGVKVTFNNVEWACSTCHNVEEPLPGTGPYLYGVANHATEHGAQIGLDAVGYLADSILNPSSVIAPAQVAPDGTEYVWTDGVMPNNWNTVIDDVILADLVAYLMQQNQAGEDHSGH